MNESRSSLSLLYVDLDGTFIKSDMLLESLLVALKKNPLIIFMCFAWVFRGKSFLKYKISQEANINTSLLPLNTEFYSFLLDQKKSGRKIILATASNEKYAENICKNYTLFDSFISSNATNNLKGNNKLKKIISRSDTFSYAGNSFEDFAIFERAEDSYLVNPTKRVKNHSLKADISQTFDAKPSINITVWLRQLRIPQWFKNFLIFVPLLVSGEFLNMNLLIKSFYGFFSFSCLASATYIINDLLDLESDRSHSRKKLRPLAASQISIIGAASASVVLFLISFALALSFEGPFIYVLIAYLTVTLMYSFKIKQYIGMDVITLASLYTIRILAGAAILSVPLSFWLLSFSMFIFLSLALVKRCAELKSLEEDNTKMAKGRDYHVKDYGLLMSFGTSSALLSVLMFCFYINDNILNNQYQEPTILWFIVPALSYWLMRMWIKTHRGEMHDDPIVFSLRDAGSIITIGFIVVITLLAQLL